MPPLPNAKHEAVALAYLTDPEKVGWRAYKAVYPKSSRHAAETGFGRLMKNARFAARVADLTVAAAKAADVSIDRVLREMAAIGFSNVFDYMHVGPDGLPVADFSQLSRAQAAAVQEITIDTFVDGAGEDGREVRRVRFKLHDKRGALVDLGRHLGLFRHKVEVEDPTKSPKVAEVRDLNDIEVARRIAFLLHRVASKKDKPDG